MQELYKTWSGLYPSLAQLFIARPDVKDAYYSVPVHSKCTLWRRSFAETLEFFTNSHGVNQPLNFSRHLTLSTRHPIFIVVWITHPKALSDSRVSLRRTVIWIHVFSIWINIRQNYFKTTWRTWEEFRMRQVMGFGVCRVCRFSGCLIRHAQVVFFSTLLHAKFC